MAKCGLLNRQTDANSRDVSNALYGEDELEWELLRLNMEELDADMNGVAAKIKEATTVDHEEITKWGSEALVLWTH